MQLAHLEIMLNRENAEEKKNSPSYQMGSLFHGWLMENISPEYAGFLHRSGMNPFSQYIEKTGDKLVWHISALNKQACGEIIAPFLEGRHEYVAIIHKKEIFKIEDIKLASSYASYKELADMYYLEIQPARIINLKFITPAAFRSGGEYQIFPTLHLIYQNLINRWNLFADKLSLEEENLSQLLASHSFIARYRLESRYFPLEKVSIPAFAGSMSIKISAPPPMVSLVNMLFAYAALAGIGIKTSLGMGGVKIG